MAVYTPVPETELRNFLSGYDLPELKSFHGILQGVQNTNYRLEMATGDVFILTLFEKEIDPQDIPFFFAFSGHLAAHSISSPCAVGNRAGEMIGRLCDRPAAIVTFLAGRDITADEITAMHCAELGVILGRMHRVAMGFSGYRKNALSLSGWKELAEKTASHADGVVSGLAKTIADEITVLERRWPGEDDLPRAAVHADLFPDNVFFQDGRISGVIDFYFSCTDFLAYDLAIVINAWCFDQEHNMVAPRLRAILTAYTAERDLNAAEKELFNVLCRGAAMRFLLTRLHDGVFFPPGAMVTPKDPVEYLKKLQWHQNHDIAC